MSASTAASSRQELHRFCHVDGRKFANYERVCPQCGTARLVALDSATSAAFNAPAVTSQKRESETKFLIQIENKNHNTYKIN
jgi:hypothetical protein